MTDEATEAYRELGWLVPPRFAVRRSDDNGGEFEVARYTSRCEAEAVAGELTARGHKQVYWVEPLAPAA